MEHGYEAAPFVLGNNRTYKTITNAENVLIKNVIDRNKNRISNVKDRVDVDTDGSK